MYIRFKMFSRKAKEGYEKPLLFIEINGDRAVELFIIQFVERFYSTIKAERIKKILQEDF